MIRAGTVRLTAARWGRAVGALAAALALVVGSAMSGTGPARVSAVERPDSLGLRATYNVSATLRWARRRLIVTSTAEVTNTTADPIGALSFNLVPARIGNMVLRSVQVDGSAANSTVDDQTIVVDLPDLLEANEQTSVTISYRSTFTGNGTDKNWLFAKLEGYATAYRWIPWLSRPVPFDRSNIGDPFETSVSPLVEVSITTDRPLVIATTGRRTGGDGLTQTFAATNVRDFNFSASPDYQMRTETFRGINISYYYRRLPIDKIQRWTRNAVGRFSDEVGVYPYTELTIAEVHDTSAMESPQMIWMPWSTPGWNIPYLTVHELGHQWFYGVVGNSQPSEPFADEALTDFLTRDYLGHRQSRCAANALDMTIYDYNGRCYYETIYIQGDQYINSYRQTVGDDSFWAALQGFYDEYRFERVGTREFWDFMDLHTGYAGGHADRFPSLYP